MQFLFVICVENAVVQQNADLDKRHTKYSPGTGLKPFGQMAQNKSPPRTKVSWTNACKVGVIDSFR